MPASSLCVEDCSKSQLEQAARDILDLQRDGVAVSRLQEEIRDRNASGQVRRLRSKSACQTPWARRSCSPDGQATETVTEVQAGHSASLELASSVCAAQWSGSQLDQAAKDLLDLQRDGVPVSWQRDGGSASWPCRRIRSKSACQPLPTSWQTRAAETVTEEVASQDRDG